MQQIYKDLLIDFPDESEIWVYSADRFISDAELEIIKPQLFEFVTTWSTHGKPLKADFHILDNCFLIFVTDNSFGSASGCSIDSSVRVVKKIGEEIGVNFFNRLKLLVRNDRELKHISFHDLEDYSTWQVADTAIKNLGEFRTRFFSVVEESNLLRK